MNSELGVVVPVYNTLDRNRTSYLIDSVDSALAQNFDFTLLIVDNGSTDEDTLDFYESLKDSRVTIKKIGREFDQKGTPSVSLNYGLNWLYEKKAEAFCYLHSDDLLTKDSLEKRIERLNDRSDMIYGVVGYLLDSVLKYRRFPLKGEDVCSSEVLRSGFPHHASMWSRKMMEIMLKNRNGVLFDEKIKANEDIEVTLYCRKLIDDVGFKLGFLDELSYVWINHPGNITNSVNIEIRKEQSKYAYEKNGFKLPAEFSWKHTIKHLGSRYIPQKLKNPLMPLRNVISKVTRGSLFPTQRLENINEDPYWFKKIVTTHK